MRNIHFDNIGGNPKYIAMMIIAILCMVVGTFELIDFDNPKINKYLFITGILTVTIFLSKMFWYRNYVQWNKKGAVIRLNSFTTKSVRFDEIRATALNDEEFLLKKRDGETLAFNLHNIVKSDAQKLNEIVKENTAAYTA